MPFLNNITILLTAEVKRQGVKKLNSKHIPNATVLCKHMQAGCVMHSDDRDDKAHIVGMAAVCVCTAIVFEEKTSFQTTSAQ
jgi:hypothetical protein